MSQPCSSSQQHHLNYSTTPDYSNTQQDNEELAAMRAADVEITADTRNYVDTILRQNEKRIVIDNGL